MKLYISGPMSGIEAFNFPAFNAAAAQLRAQGYEVVSPAEIVNEYKGWESAMRDNIRELVTCDGIALLPGWAKSRGAALEVHIAASLGLVVGYIGNGSFESGEAGREAVS